MKTSEKENSRSVKEITYSAILIAIGAVLISLSYLTIFSDILIILFIPFLGAVASLKLSFKSQLIFLVCCVAISFIDIQEGFFSFLPNIIIGLAYGDFVKRFSLSFYSFLGALTISILVNIGLVYPINFIYQIDMISIYAAVFHLPKETFSNIFPSFYLFLCLVQILVAHIILTSELKKIVRVPQFKVKNEFTVILISSLLLLAGLVISHFFLKWLEYLFFCYFVLVSSYAFTSSFTLIKKWMVFFYCITIGVGLILFSVSFCFLSQPDYYLSLIFLTSSLLLDGLVMIEYSCKAIGNGLPLADEKKDLLKP